ncbi:IS3 family transposase [Streptococcus mitis]
MTVENLLSFLVIYCSSRKRIKTKLKGLSPVQHRI